MKTSEAPLGARYTDGSKNISLLERSLESYLDNGSINISLLTELNLSSVPSLQSHLLPTQQKVSKRPIHLIKRIGAEQNRLKMCRIVFFGRCRFEIKRPQLSVTHFIQFSGG